MDIKIFRAYAGGDSDFDYIFSIVATNSGASFVVPKGDVERSSVFDQQRIDELARGREGQEVPADPEGWAILASYNAGWGVGVKPVDGLIFESLEATIEEEQDYADYLYEKYSYLREPRQEK
jgi:hypothetical protein